MFYIEFYKLKNGREPVKDFLDELPIKMRIKALDGITILQEKGNALREPYSKIVAKGLFELRIKFGSDNTRIFYFFYAANKIILTNGFLKKSKKTSKLELERALKYKNDYEGGISDG